MPDTVITPTARGKILSFPISKVDRTKREVWGFATTEALDQQGEIVDYDASVRAFDKWTSMFDQTTQGKSLGNVREMHGPKAVGKMIAYHPDQDARGIWVGVKVSDSIEGNDAWRKVEEGVLNGFSIGAPRAERRMEYHGANKVNRVVEYDLAELSLVDNPACPESFFHEVKVASTIDGPAYAMELIKRFEPDAQVSGEDWTPQVTKIVQKTVELNPETFVDGSGNVYTRISGRIVKGNQMDQKELEKAGKKIGPAHKPPGVPPGPKAEAKTDDAAPTLPKAEGMGKEAPPASNPVLSGDAANDGRNAGNGEHEKNIKDESTAPDAMGKEAEGRQIGAHDEAAEHNAAKSNDPDIDGKVAAAKASYCSLCGGPMKSFGDNVAPYHKNCAKSVTDASKSTSATKAAHVGTSMTEEGLIKAVASAINPAIKTMNDNFAAMSKRIDDLEKSPAPGGPLRTELPMGVTAMEKGAGSKPQVDGEQAVLEKAMSIVADPAARQAISMQLAKSSIKDVQNRKIMG